MVSLFLSVHDQFFIFTEWPMSYLGHMKNFLRTVTYSSSVHEFFMNTSRGQFISKSSWTKTMNYSSPVHEQFMNGLKGSWFHELHFAGVATKLPFSLSRGSFSIHRSLVLLACRRRRLNQGINLVSVEKKFKILLQQWWHLNMNEKWLLNPFSPSINKKCVLELSKIFRLRTVFQKKKEAT